VRVGLSRRLRRRWLWVCVFESVTLLIVYLLLALGFSFLCSILEASLLSMPPSYVKKIEGEGSKKGALLARLKEDIDRPLAAILSLNTIAHTVGAAGVGAQAAALFGQAYFGLISAVLTLLILFFSEIIPKTLGAIYWKGLTGFTVYTCQAIIVSLMPLVWVSKKLTKLIQPRGTVSSTVSREEIVALAQLGYSAGVIAESEREIIRNLIRSRSLKVQDIMTPRSVAGMLSGSLSCGEALGCETALRFSRILVHKEDSEEVFGYALKQRILEEAAFDRHGTLLGEVALPIHVISEKASLAILIRDLIYGKEQIALVVDEYGSMSGLVTKEDLIETLLGLEIMDESDHIEDMREFARQRWRERASKMGIEIPD